MAARRVGIALKPKKPEARVLLTALVAWLRSRGHEVLLDEEAGRACPDCGDSHPRAAVVGQADLVVVLGGDGTLLSVARMAGPREVPILGVNLGGLGFLTEVSVQEMYPTLEAALADRCAVTRRLTLQVTVRRGAEVVAAHEALNDAVVTKTVPSRIVELAAFVNDEYVTTYRADGLIICTPTGSTAYGLSAGGPIVYPSLPALVMIPICPHTLTNRPLVLPDTARIEVRHATGEDVHLTVDGQVDVGLQRGDVVAIRRSLHTITLVKSSTLNYFELLRAKLRWGER